MGRGKETVLVTALCKEIIESRNQLLYRLRNHARMSPSKYSASRTMTRSIYKWREACFKRRASSVSNLNRVTDEIVM